MQTLRTIELTGLSRNSSLPAEALANSLYGTCRQHNRHLYAWSLPYGASHPSSFAAAIHERALAVGGPSLLKGLDPGSQRSGTAA